MSAQSSNIGVQGFFCVWKQVFLQNTPISIIFECFSLTNCLPRKHGNFIRNCQIGMKTSDKFFLGPFKMFLSSDGGTINFYGNIPHTFFPRKMCRERLIYGSLGCQISIEEFSEPSSNH